MNATPPPPLHGPAPQQPRSSRNPKGSLWAGIGLAWLIVCGGYMVVAGTLSSLGGYMSYSVSLSLVSLPWLAAVVTAIVLMTRDKPRTGGGIFLGLLSILAVAILLVAACFGLIGLGNMH